jgi:hypothetical protein
VIPSETRATRLHARGKVTFASEAITFLYARPNGADTNCTSRHIGDGTAQAISALALMVNAGASRVEHDFEFWIDLQTSAGNRFFWSNGVTSSASAQLAIQSASGRFADTSTEITSVVIKDPFNATMATIRVRADLIFEPR